MSIFAAKGECPMLFAPIRLLAHLESIEADQINLGLYTTRVTAEDLRRAIAEAEGTAPLLAEVEVALRNLVIQVGATGAGKTEAFLFPILLDIASEPLEMRQRRGVCAVLVYPRIRLEPSLGIGVVTEVDDAGQVRGASAVVVQPDHARDFLDDGDWERRWGGDEHKPYETPGGVHVRSRAEYIIATKLEAAGIPFEYEPRLPYTDDDGHARFIHPDFYLYEHDLYVEYWGRDDPEYVESRRFKEGVYERLAAQRGVCVLHLEAGDVENDVFVGKIQAVISNNDTR